MATTLASPVPAGPTPPATAAPISGAFAAPPVGAAVAGTKSTISLRLADAQPAPFTGRASIALYASSTPTLSANATRLTGLALAKLSVRAGVAKTVKLNFIYPADLPKGAYYLIASITAAAAGATPDNIASTSAVSVSPRFVDLSATFTNGQPASVLPGQACATSLTIENLGTLTASAAASVSLYASPTSALNASATLITSIPRVRLRLKPGGFKTFPIDFTAPADAPGTYFLLASVISVPPSGGALSSEVAVIGTQHP